MLKRRTYQQALWKNFFRHGFPQMFFPHSTGAVEKFWSAESPGSGGCYFLVSEQESNQRSRPKGRFEKAPPLETPAALLAGDQKCSDFWSPTAQRLAVFFLGRHPKIGTFSGVGWRCGGWILKAGAFSKRLLKWPSFGTFLGEARKVHDQLY